MTDTVRVRGEGGWEFDMDVPSDPLRRELFDDAVANGRLVILDSVEDESDQSVVPGGSIASVVEWVRGGTDDQDPRKGWDQRASQALAVELAKGDKARSGLVDLLSTLVNPPVED